jgi:microcystin-dependent protein
MANTTNFAVEKPTVGGYRNSWGGTINTGLDKIDELLHLAMPIGTIQMYPKATAPTATTNGGTWLVCDGSSLVRTDYPDLHTLITNTYGTYPSGTTFLLPDMRTRVPVGYSASTLGSGATQRTPKAIAGASGTEGHTLLDAEIPKHTHPITDAGHPHNTTETAHTHTGTTAKAKADIVLNDHTHTFERYTDYAASGSQVSTTGRFSFNPSRQDTDGVTDTFTGVALLDEDGSSNNGHQHSISGINLATVATALTIDDATTGITVNEQGTGDTSHNIMQPYLVVNYIILAKHPTF